MYYYMPCRGTRVRVFCVRCVRIFFWSMSATTFGISKEIKAEFSPWWQTSHIINMCTDFVSSSTFYLWCFPGSHAPWYIKEWWVWSYIAILVSVTLTDTIAPFWVICYNHNNQLSLAIIILHLLPWSWSENVTLNN